MLFAFGNPEKKINKLISKIWKDQPTTLHLVDLPDSLDATISQLHEIQSDNEVLATLVTPVLLDAELGDALHLEAQM